MQSFFAVKIIFFKRETGSYLINIAIVRRIPADLASNISDAESQLREMGPKPLLKIRKIDTPGQVAAI